MDGSTYVTNLVNYSDQLGQLINILSLIFYSLIVLIVLQIIKGA